MMISQKIKNQRPQYIGFFDADLRAGRLECQVLTQRQPCFFLYVMRLVGHICVHMSPLWASYWLAPLHIKKPSAHADALGNEEAMNHSAVCVRYSQTVILVALMRLCLG